MHPPHGLPDRITAHLRPGGRRKFLFLLLWVCSSLTIPERLTAATPLEDLHSQIGNGGYALQIDGRVIFASRLDSPFIPASTIKVLTALMALEILGPEYRFATRFFVDEENNLYVKGEGDPFFTSETIITTARMLKDRGITHLQKIVLDDSAFALDGPSPGSSNSSNPYDAHSSALAVNFNALPFQVSPNGGVLSGEPQTPLLPMMIEFAEQYRRGKYRVNVSAFAAGKDCSNILRYTGELLTALYRQEGITIEGGYKRGFVPAGAKSVLVYESEKRVADLIHLCLSYSSNFIGNQLYLSCGARIYGYPATWEKSADMTATFIDRRLTQAQGQIRMVDGSGLSTENRITPAAMLAVLNRFAPYASLLKKQKNTYLKSGTLTGVYCYVGYFSQGQKLAPFALFLNQQRNNRKTLLRLLEKSYHTTVTEW